MGFANHNLVNKSSSLCRAAMAIRSHAERIDLGFARVPRNPQGTILPRKFVRLIPAAAFHDDNRLQIIHPNTA